MNQQLLGRHQHHEIYNHLGTGRLKMSTEILITGMTEHSRGVIITRNPMATAKELRIYFLGGFL